MWRITLRRNKAGDSLMKILLVLPRDNTYYFKGSFLRSVAYAPLTLTTLAAMVPPEFNAEITLVDEGMQEARYDEHYDLVGLTCCASSSPRAYELCDYFKKRGAFTVLGGAHPTLQPEEAARHADAVVAGAAEKSWPKLLWDWKNGATTEKIYRYEQLEKIHPPIPRRDLEKKGIYMKTPTVIATMGCGNRCEFCSINRLWGDHFKRDIGEVVEEIKALKSKTILFLDPNLTFDYDYAKDLLRALIPLKIQWAGLVGMDSVGDRELFDLIVRSGCRGLLMGFESFSPESILSSSKDKNDIKSYKRVVDTVHGHGISMLGTFVLGLDGDTRESILKTIEHIDALGLEMVRYSVLTPFPGTPLFDRFKADGRILTENWFYYDQEHVVFQPRHMTPFELQELLHVIWKKTYTAKRIFNRVVQADLKQKLLILSANVGFRYYAGNLLRVDNNQLAHLRD